MNILMIGNGFDLAHGLPTKYKDFLEFGKKLSAIYSETNILSPESYQKDYLNGWKMDEKIKRYLQDLFIGREECKETEGNTSRFKTGNPNMDEFYELIKDNCWFDYFDQCNMKGRDNWIDFESEISNVIQKIDSDMKGKSFNGQVDNLLINYLNDHCLDKRYKMDKCMEENGSNEISYREQRDLLLRNLNRLIRALEIYLYEITERIDYKRISPDIKSIMTYDFEYVDKTTIKKITKVLNFNYTSTYERIYFSCLEKSKENIDKSDVDYIDYIHGKADIKHTVENSNIVLGIDEYLPDDRKDKNIEFIAFKKFYQRIYKGTGCKYKEWINKIKSNYESGKEGYENSMELMMNALKNDDMEQLLKWSKASGVNYKGMKKKYDLYIFGHSLDVTDKDILREWILNDNVHTTIYYHKNSNEEGYDDNGRADLGAKIANLVKIIGQDELIRRTGGSTKTIEFKLQQDMVDASVMTE